MGESPRGDSKTVAADADHLEEPEDVGEKFQDDSVEAAKHELNRIDLDQLSKDALTFKSRATLRLAVVILIQGLSKPTFGLITFFHVLMNTC